jgi:hypothetical protein
MSSHYHAVIWIDHLEAAEIHDRFLFSSVPARLALIEIIEVDGGRESTETQKDWRRPIDFSHCSQRFSDLPYRLVWA